MAEKYDRVANQYELLAASYKRWGEDPHARELRAKAEEKRQQAIRERTAAAGLGAFRSQGGGCHIL